MARHLLDVEALKPMRLSRSLVAVLLTVVSVVAACGSSGDGEPAAHGGSSAGSGGATAGSAGSSAGLGGSPAGSGGSAAGSGGSAAGSGGASAGTSGSGAGGDENGDLACGASVCGPGQYCVFPCCGGAPPPCFPAPQGGMCPAGSHAGFCISGITCTPPATCCQFDPCVPPPPYCSDTAPVGCITQQGRTCHLGCA